MSSVIRFSARKRVKDENVAEHSFHVAMYAMILADMEKGFGNKVNTEKLLRSAIIHDLEESLTGDIIYDFKHSDKKLSQEIKRIGLGFYQNLMKNLPKDISKEYVELWENQKQMNTIEGKILFAADKLEALFYALEEISLGNKNFKVVAKGLMDTVKDLKLKSVDMILKEIKVR